MKYTIPRRASKCFLKGESLLPGEEIISLICPVKDRYERRDYCLKCWKVMDQENLVKEDGSFWKVQIPLKQGKAPGVTHGLSEKQAFDLFCSLLDNNEEKETLFVLALYLERKKVLVKRAEKKSIDSASHELVYECLESGDIFVIQSVPSSSLDYRQVHSKIDLCLYTASSSIL